MNRGNRLQHTLLAAFFVAGVFSSPLGATEKKEMPSGTESIETVPNITPAPPSLAPNTDAGNTNNGSAEPAKVNETTEIDELNKVVTSQINSEDLKAQQTMAKASEEMTHIAWWQLIATFASVGGLGATLYYAHKTALSGQASAAVAEKMLNSVERPYIFLFGVHGIRTEDYMGDDNFFIKYSIANHGKTPAILEYFSSEVNFGTYPCEPKDVYAGHPAKRTPIMPSAEVREEQCWCPNNMSYIDNSDEWGESMLPVPATKDGEDFFFRIVVRYRGPFTEGYETSACWRWDKDALCLLQYGGTIYNYTNTAPST